MEANATDPVIGLELHGFIVTRALCAGGMGLVYEACHPMINHRVAVKVLRPEFSGNTEVSARFLREARAMSAVKHRNVVEITNFGQLPNGAEYMMMELVEGETLSEIIAREAPMPPVRALQICEEILAGLAAAHAAGVIHRDLKPGNVVLMKQSSEEPLVKLLDFGLARQLGAQTDPLTAASMSAERVDRSSILAGTPEYISPEQASGRRVDGRGDLYALGVILFEMLTGRLPFESESAWDLLQLHRSAVPPLVSTLRADLYAPLDAFVDQLLSKDPLKRPSSARAARATVLQLAEEIRAIPQVATPLIGPLVREVRPPQRPVRRRARVPALAAGLVLLVVASIFAASITSSAASAPEAVEPVGARVTGAAPAGNAAPPPLILEAEAVIIAEPELVSVKAQTVRASPPLPPRKAHRKAAIKPRAAPAPTCEANESWRRQLLQQIETLEQLSIAALPDSANPSVVASVKSRSRVLAGAVNTASGPGCAHVEAQLFAWKAAIQ